MAEGAKPRVAFPDARYFAVTWGIPDAYGGMTSVLLHRARAFYRLGGRAVEILTFDARPDYREVESDLRERGELLPAMRLTNLWEWLREHDLPGDAPGSLRLEKHPFLPLEPGVGSERVARDSSVFSRTRFADDGATVLQVDYFRPDGTLLASDLRDPTQPGSLGGRSVVLCDSAGEPARSWGSIWGLYRFWLDLLRGGSRSIMLVDSKTAARFMLGYRRDDALAVHIVHGTHLSDSEPGVIRKSRTAVFDNLAGFDSVVVLTRRQKTDIESQLGRVPNLTVIPNSAEPDSEPASAPVRDEGRGVVIASLSELKRVDHAVRATLSAARDSARPLSLDIFGEGSQRDSLDELLRLHDAAGIVRMHGHRSDARRHLAEASFLLLTSRSEAFAMVLLESMSAGCIPISYDISYGPADIISHGRNGFLVAPGDEVALAEAILTLQRMRPAQVARLRRNARRTAAQYSDLAITKLWARELRQSLRLKLAALAKR